MLGLIRQYKQSIAWVAIVGLVVAALTSVITLAQTDETNQVTISVTPPSFEIDANPGDTIDNKFRIINGSDQALTLTTTPKNFTAEGEEGGVNLTEEDTAFSLADWISVSPETVDIPARGSQVFDFTISVPANAEPGGHFGSVIVQTEAVSVDSTGAAVSQEAGPLILVRVAGDITESASIASFGSSKNFWESGPITFETRVENTGNVHFKPSGTITIKNTFGNEVTNMNLEEQNVLPGTIRKLVNEWDPGFAVGRYTADLTLVYGENGQIDTASTTFIIFPYKTIVPAFIGLAVLVYIVIRSRKRIAAAGRALAGK